MSDKRGKKEKEGIATTVVVAWVASGLDKSRGEDGMKFVAV